MADFSSELPDESVVAETIGTLLGIATEAREVDSPAHTAAFALSLHSDADGNLIGAVASDIELAASTAVAIAGQSPRNAEDAIHKRALGLDLWDNFREVSNVLNILFTRDRQFRVLLHSVQRIELPLWSRLQHALIPSRTFAVDIQGYPSAHLSIFLLSGAGDAELVAALRSAGEEAAAHDKQVVGGKLIRVYDFHQPKGIERSQLNALRANLLPFTRSSADAMSSLLSTAVHVKLVQLHHQGWDDYAGTLDANAFITTFRLDPLPGQFILTFSPGLSMKCLDCRLSGADLPGSARRTLTDLDVALLSPIVESVARSLAETFSAFVPVRPRIVRHVTEKYLMEGATLSLTWLVAWMTVSVAGSTFDASLCLPVVPLQPVLTAMVEAAQRGDHGKHADHAPVEEVIEEVDLDLAVHFPPVRVPLAELARLKKGSLIKLGVERSASLLMSSGGRLLATVDPVVVGHQLQAQVAELVDDPEELFLSLLNRLPGLTAR